MRDLAESEKEKLLKEVRLEFPDDELMQQIHYVRLIHELQTRGMSADERIRFYQAAEIPSPV